jgi:tRNA-guanine family transglycosylase
MVLLKRLFFMPVGTVASVKGVHQRELKMISIRYYFREYLSFVFAKTEMKKAGGLHKFMNWDRNILILVVTKYTLFQQTEKKKGKI